MSEPLELERRPLPDQLRRIADQIVEASDDGSNVLGGPGEVALLGWAISLRMVADEVEQLEQVEKAAGELWAALNQQDAADESPWAASAHKLWLALTAVDRRA